MPGARLAHVAWVGSSVSAGFILLFAVAGLVISAGGRVLITAMPWLGGLVGLGLIVLGIALLAGRSWSSALFEQLADRIGPGGATTQRGFFLFGVAYGLASLSCTLPIFLVVVGNALTRGDLLGSMVQFLSYALGMATVVVSLTLALGVFKAGLVHWLRPDLASWRPRSGSGEPGRAGWGRIWGARPSVGGDGCSRIARSGGAGLDLAIQAERWGRLLRPDLGARLSEAAGPMWSRRWQASAGMARGAFMVGREDHVADEPAGHRWERLPVPPDVVASRGRGAGL